MQFAGVSPLIHSYRVLFEQWKLLPQAGVGVAIGVPPDEELEEDELDEELDDEELEEVVMSLTQTIERD